MNSILRWGLFFFTSFYELLLVILFPVFWLFGKHRGKTLGQRTGDAFLDAATYDPIPDDAEAAEKARRKGRKPGQLTDFE